jgi:hypothetical protein
VEIADPTLVNRDIVLDQRHGAIGMARRLWDRWKHVARKIGDFQARALMTLFYFLILGPLALVLRWCSDPLAIKVTTPRGWQTMGKKAGTPLEQSRRQS